MVLACGVGVDLVACVGACEGVLNQVACAEGLNLVAYEVVLNLDDQLGAYDGDALVELLVAYL